MTSGCALGSVDYLSMVELAEHEGAIWEWLTTDPEMGKRTLCSKMLSEKGCHVNVKTAENYLRLCREPVTPTRRRRRSMRGSVDVADEPAEARECLSMGQLAEHEVAIQGWLSTDPEMGARTIYSEMLSEKGCNDHSMAGHPGESMAESLLREAEEEFTARERRLEHRYAGFVAVLRSDDYVYVRSSLPIAAMPKAPIPSDDKVRKRTWEKQMGSWRSILAMLRRGLELGWQ